MREAPAPGRAPAVSDLAAGSPRPLAERFDTALLDLDGVVYVGADAVPGAADALRRARAAGMRLAFVTNNAARTPETVAAHLCDLGVEASVDEVVTSAQAAATMVADRVAPGSRVLVVGGDGLVEALRERGLRPVSSADDDPAAVVQGFAPHVDWAMLTEGVLAVRRGVPWVAANMDLTVPTARGLAPGNGALVTAVAAATGATPEVAGKPEPALHRESTRRSGAREPLVVGDRLDTDIEGAVRAGVPSLLVLTGVTSPADLLAAAPERRPTYVAEGLASGLLEPHPPVTRDGDAWVCTGWRAVSDARGWRVEGEGSRVDGLRALCVGVWSGAAPDARLEEALQVLERVRPG